MQEKASNEGFIVNRIWGWRWSLTYSTLIIESARKDCFGAPFPSVYRWIAKQFGWSLSSVISRGVTEGRHICFCPALMDIDWMKRAHIYIHSASLPAAGSNPSHLWWKPLFTDKDKKDNAKGAHVVLTHAIQNISTEVIRSVCSALDNIIVFTRQFILYFFYVMCFKDRWRALVERFCCLWRDLGPDRRRALCVKGC